MADGFAELLAAVGDHPHAGIGRGFGAVGGLFLLGRVGVGFEMDEIAFAVAVAALAVAALAGGLTHQCMEGIAEIRQVEAILRTARTGNARRTTLERSSASSTL